MDITELLKKEHQEVSGLFEQFFGGGTITRLVKRVVGARPPRRKAVAARICDALTMHTRLEEEIFYPDVRATGDQQLNKLVDESEREHAGVKEKIAKAETLLDDEALGETMSAMQSDVDHHVREEETEMFPLLHNVASDHRLQELGRRYAAAKRALKGGRSAARSRSAGKARKAAGAARRQASRTTAKRGRKRATAPVRNTSGSRKRKTSSRAKSTASASRQRRTRPRSTKRARAGRGR